MINEDSNIMMKNKNKKDLDSDYEHDDDLLVNYDE